MKPRQIFHEVYLLASPHWDRRLFDSLIPLPDGTSYNAYIIEGSEKTALIDSTDPEKAAILMEQLEEFNKIDYLVSLHAEQDHSGTIPSVLSKYPGIKIVTNTKAKGLLIDLLHLKDADFITIADGDSISLGGKTLKFLLTPWVHWPETMVAYLEEDKILFSCDFFGSHLATSDVFATDEALVLEAAKRYYSEIMMPFRTMIKKNLEKLSPFEIKMIAPSHGPVYQNPSLILDAYKEWISDKVKNVVVLPYVSMHGSTKKMVDYFINSLITKGITVKPFNLEKTDIGNLALALVDAATLILGTPAFLAGPHPLAAYAAFLANVIRPKTKFVSIVGSYSWGMGKLVDMVLETIPNIKATVLEPVFSKGLPREEDYKALEKLAETIVEKHKTLGLM